MYAMWPNPDNDLSEDEQDDDSVQGNTEFKDWEMQNIKTPTSNVTSMPFTPRTQAFHTLNRQLPLRQPSGPQYR